MAVTIHHLNCATMCPFSARLLSGEGGWLKPAELVAHVLVIETDAGLVLVDTGLGTADVAHPARTSGSFRRLVRPQFRLEETATEQIKALGHSPSDVRHVVLTHLDVDHAGGLGDFPQADVHIFETELEAALNPRRGERARYIQAQWEHGPKWVRYTTDGDQWFGFDAVRAVPATNEEILIVPLPGHTRGHSMIAVKTGEGWLLHCGDAYLLRGEVATPPKVPRGVALYQAVNSADRKLRGQNIGRLREFVAAHGKAQGPSAGIEFFCSHDRQEFIRLSTT